MKKKIISILKILVPLALGIYLVVAIYNSLSPDERSSLFEAIRNADYSWVAISIVMGILSHMSRAYRWKFLMEPMNYFPRFLNCFFAVMVGYIVNMALPRAGEASRGAVLARYENVPFEKSFGSILAERAIDLIILVIITGTTIILQFELLEDAYIKIRDAFIGKFTLLNSIILGVSLIILGFVVFIVFRRARDSKIAVKIRDLLLGLVEGLKTIFTMRKKWAFLFHTLSIWVLYIGMYWICFLSIPETISVPIGGVFAGFVFGSFAIVLVPGGIGAFPVAIMQSLMLYSVERENGFALGWILWMAQTALIIVVGGISLFLLPRYNKKLQENGRSPATSTS